MKFAAHLAAHITPEWRKQYINYEELKRLLYETVENVPAADKCDVNTSTRYFVEADEAFFGSCEKELSKVNTFYSEKIAEATRKFASLQHDLAAAFSMDVIEKPSYYAKNRREKAPKKPSAKKIRKLRVAFSELYLSLVLLQNYQTLNYSGFRKISKKRDKLFSSKNGEYWRRDNADSAPFYVNKDTDRLIEETENLVTTYLEDGNRQRATKRLHIPPIGEHQSLRTTFQLGLLVGFFVSLLGIVAFCAAFAVNGNEAEAEAEAEYQVRVRVAIRLYRGTFLSVLFLFFAGLNVYGWRTSGVNHVLIFEINPRNHLSELHIMQISMIFGIFWTLGALGFVFGESLGVPAYVNPLLLLFSTLAFLLNPFKILFHGARRWFLKILARIISAPLFKVDFADFWLAEQLTSLAPIFSDVDFFICFYADKTDWASAKYLSDEAKSCLDKTSVARPLLMCLPAWFRFAQCLRRYRDSKRCFPHLLSSMKYVATSSVVFFAFYNVRSKQNERVEPNTYFYLWMVAVVLSTTFTFVWDIKVDWGLLSGRAAENKFLREQIIYSSETYYFTAIGSNFILRFCWSFSLSLLDVTYPKADLPVTILMSLEIFRRFVWNFFRLENEHLNNCGEFRAIRDISIVPLETIDRDQDVLLRMMDEDDGVTNRPRKSLPRTASKYEKKNT